ncbi:uncharacterized protein METZ01_LOCUS93206, partial [marine metagenome]
MGRIADLLDAEIVNTGIGGSSYWTAIIHFTKNFHKFKDLDYCIFAWTDPFRTYHSKGDLNPVSAYDGSSKKHKAAQMFYEELVEWNKERLNFQAVAYWLDHEYLSKMKGKILHLWSFGDTKVEPWNKAELKDINYLYTWKHGTEIRKPLYYISCRTDPKRAWCEENLPFLQNLVGFRVNHLGPEGDKQVF